MESLMPPSPDHVSLRKFNSEPQRSVALERSIIFPARRPHWHRSQDQWRRAAVSVPPRDAHTCD